MPRAQRSFPVMGRALSLTSFQVHIDKDGQEQTASSKKLMHHITEADVHKAMDEVEKGSN